MRLRLRSLRRRPPLAAPRHVGARRRRRHRPARRRRARARGAQDAGAAPGPTPSCASRPSTDTGWSSCASRSGARPRRRSGSAMRRARARQGRCGRASTGPRDADGGDGGGVERDAEHMLEYQTAGRRHALRRCRRRGCSRASTTSTAGASARSCRRCPSRDREAGRAPRRSGDAAGQAAGRVPLDCGVEHARLGQRRARAGRPRRAERRRRGDSLGRGDGRRRARRVPHRACERGRLRRPRPARVSRRRREPGAFRRKNRVRRFQIAFGAAREQRFDVEIPADPAADAAHWRDPFWVPLPKPMPASCVTVIVTEVALGKDAAPPEELRHGGDRRAGGVHRARQPRGGRAAGRRSGGAPDCTARLPLLVGLGARGGAAHGAGGDGREGLRRANA